MRAPPLADIQIKADLLLMAASIPRTKRSPTTEPIEPPINLNSNAATTTLTSKILPCITIKASFSPTSFWAAFMRSA